MVALGGGGPLWTTSMNHWDPGRVGLLWGRGWGQWGPDDRGCRSLGTVVLGHLHGPIQGGAGSLIHVVRTLVVPPTPSPILMGRPPQQLVHVGDVGAKVMIVFRLGSCFGGWSCLGEPSLGQDRNASPRGLLPDHLLGHSLPLPPKRLLFLVGLWADQITSPPAHVRVHRFGAR